MTSPSSFALVFLAALSALPVAVQAEEANPLSFNISLTSEYRYRGISQTRFKPALQGGADYVSPSGFYVGTWLSSIKWIKDAGTIASVDTGSANLEWDLYGGYKGEIRKDFGYDVGLLQYVYPGNNYDRIPGAKNANTTELYGALNYGVALLKYSHSLTSLFGTADTAIGKTSRNSGYLEASAAFDVGSGVTITPHIGYQRVANFSNASYTDYSVTAAKDWVGFTFSAAVVGADVKKVNGVPAYASPSQKDLGDTRLVVAIKKTF